MYSFLSPFQTPTSPGRDRCFSEKEAKTIRRLHDEEGWSYRQLAKTFNTHPATIGNVILGRGAYHYLGERDPRPQPRPIDEQEIALIRRLYVREDLLSGEIAKRVGRSRATILKIINLYDW